MNPRYILVLAGAMSYRAGAKVQFRVMRLADGQEGAAVPSYHPVPRGRASGLYSREAGVSVIADLLAGDGVKADIARGKAERAGFTAQ